MVQLLRAGESARCRSTASRRTPRRARTRRRRAVRSRRRAGRSSLRARSGSSLPAPQTILPTAGSTAIAAPFDPITGPGACATSSAADQADTATYRMDPVPTGGFTLLGSPTVVADITSAGLRLADRGAAARRRHGHQHADPGRAWPVAAGDHRHARAPGVPAAPERLPVRRRPRREAGAAAEGLEHGGRQQLRPHVQQPAERDDREPGAAAAGASSRPGALGGLVQDPAAEGAAAGLHAGGRLPDRVLSAAEGSDAAARRRSCPAYRGVHDAEPHARAAARVLRRATRRSRRPTSSPWARRTPTARRRCSPGCARYDVVVGQPGTPRGRGRRRGSTVSLTDVRNQGDLTDYTGELQATHVAADHGPHQRARTPTSRPRSRTCRCP